MRTTPVLKEEVLSDYEIVTDEEFRIEESQASSESEHFRQRKTSKRSSSPGETGGHSSGYNKSSKDSPRSSMSWLSTPEGRASFSVFGAELHGQFTVTGGPLMSPLGHISAHSSPYSSNIKVSLSYMVLNES